MYGLFDEVENESVEIYLHKPSPYDRIAHLEIHKAYEADFGYLIITERYPMGLFHDKEDCFKFRTVDCTRLNA